MEHVSKSLSLSTFSQAEVPERIRVLFVILHGRYGNQLLDKYRFLQNGVDKGMEIAQRTWAMDLAAFDDDTILKAIAAAKAEHPVWPPTSGEFATLCKRLRRPSRPAEAAPQLGVSRELRSKYVRGLREDIARTLASRAGMKSNASGLAGLLSNIAAAVGLAGGDEAKTLLALEDQYLRSRA